MPTKTIVTFLIAAAITVGAAGQTSGTSFRNTSALLTLGPGQSSATIGFIVGTPAGQAPSYELIRAVGPTLKTFGIANPLGSPRVTLFDSTGAVVPFPTVFAATPDWASINRLVGAFPLTGGEAMVTSYWIPQLKDGAYTVRVTDDSGKGGTVLVEVYLLPASQMPPPIPI